MENKSVEGVLKKHLSPIYDHPDEMDDDLCNIYEEIYAAMREYAQEAVGDKEKEIEGLKQENDWMKSMLAKTIKP